MAIDSNGDICCGVSTSGTHLKFPGRVGDSPIIGAGGYCDNRVGAAALTGKGELAIRLSSARSIIFYIKNGMKVEEACVRAMRDVHEMVDNPRLNCMAFDRNGNMMAASTSSEVEYYHMGIDSEEVETRKGIWVKK